MPRSRRAVREKHALRRGILILFCRRTHPKLFLTTLTCCTHTGARLARQTRRNPSSPRVCNPSACSSHGSWCRMPTPFFVEHCVASVCAARRRHLGRARRRAAPAGSFCSWPMLGAAPLPASWSASSAPLQPPSISECFEGPPHDASSAEIRGHQAVLTIIFFPVFQ